jgi:hypothetical protein
MEPRKHAEKLVNYYERLVEEHPENPHWPICLATAQNWLRLIDEPDPGGINLLVEDLEQEGYGSGWIDMRLAVKAWRKSKARHCEICKQEIDLERSEYIPDTRLCSDHARAIEKFGGEFIVLGTQGSLSKAGSLKKNYGDVGVEKQRNHEALRKLRDSLEM